MTANLKEQILSLLSAFTLPGDESDMVAGGRVSEPVVSKGESGDKVICSINVPAEKAQELEPMRAQAQKAIEGLEGIESAVIVLTAIREASQDSPANPQPATQSAPPKSPPRPRPPPAKPIEGVSHVIAIASGKGGVGKSTTAVNLALALANRGLKIGILDADIYGPSLPRLLGLNGKPEAVGRTLHPMEKFNLKAMSIGLLVAEESPMVWRGPMVISALTQLLREVAWAPLDVLVVDMPPGTGDAHLTLAQSVPLGGAVIVSTPQDLALVDARKGINMFKKVNVPILGIIENMSGFVCPKCGEQTPLFGQDGARLEAEKTGTAFLGAVPLNLDLRTLSDAGKPIVASDPKNPIADVYAAIAEKIADQLA